ncbi:MAG TPA: terminase large subunit [Actinomycetota bacterium]|nr:terminase large subunit [Actinomycetota bacterium]
MAASEGPFVIDFIEAHCRITAGERTGEAVHLLEFQRELIEELYALDDSGRRRYRQAYLQMPRKNGKTYLLACLSLYEAATGEPGGEIYYCAGDRHQAGRAFRECRRIIEMDPELRQLFRLYRQHIEVPSSGTILRVLSSDAGLQQGLSPSFVVFDEVAVQPDDRLWNTMTLGSGARTQPLTVGISTPGWSKDSLAYRLYDYGKRVSAGETDDDSFFFKAFEPADPDCDHRGPEVWRDTNPALGHFLHEDDFRSTVLKTPESDFRRFRIGQWVASKEAALPFGAWGECVDPARVVPDSERIVLGFDGSFNHDATALIGCTIEDPHLFVVDIWEQPDDDPMWRVPMTDVIAAIKDAARRYDVAETAMDPYRWQQAMAELEDEGLPVVEYPTAAVPRIVPAWAKFYNAVMERSLTHDGDPRLARHVANLMLKSDRHGPRPTRDRNAPRTFIDAAIAAVVAYDRATAPRKRPRSRVLYTFS